MSLVSHRTDDSWTIPIQAIEVRPMTKESLECWKKEMRVGLYKKLFISKHGADVPVELINSKVKMGKAIYEIYGFGEFIIMGCYCSDYTKKKYKKGYRKKLCRVLVREIESSDDPIIKVWDLSYLQRQRWFH